MILVVLSFLKTIMTRKNGQYRRSHQRGLNGTTRVLQPAYTIRLRPEPGERPVLESANISAPSPEDFNLTSDGQTHIGRVRDHNEDAFSRLDLGDRSLFVVADGMGGHDAGETASRIAVETVCEEIRNANKGENTQQLVERAVLRANTEVRKEGFSKQSNMGTTLNIALVADGIAHIANVGDSRAYWIENGSITQITEDHSLVAKLVAMGKLTRKEARAHPKSNLLYRTIGSDERVRVDTFQVALKKGGSLLLCSDGLWGEVSDEEIHNIFTEAADPKTVCARLVRKANENGGKDNITAIVVKIG